MRARRGVAALALSLVVAACSDGEQPAGALPQITSTPSASPTATVLVPPFPATKQGAADFVRFWYATVVSRATANGDVATLRATSDPGCASCASIASFIEAGWKDGHRLVGGAVSVRFAEVASNANGMATVTCLASSQETRELDRAGRVVRTIPARRNVNLTFRLSARGGSDWRILGITRSS